MKHEWNWIEWNGDSDSEGEIRRTMLKSDKNSRVISEISKQENLVLHHQKKTAFRKDETSHPQVIQSDPFF